MIDYPFQPDKHPGKHARVKRAVKFKPTRLRIVAGDLGGRRIEYNGDPETRPMKEKTREAVFSLLGGYLDGTYAIDLFAGTGILGFEAISRGAQGAILLELSRPTVATLLANMRLLGLENRVVVQNVDSLRWLRSVSRHTAELPPCPWIIFCCPPYSIWHQRTQLLIDGLQSILAVAPEHSRLVCETDTSFDITQYLPQCAWDVRPYKPARVAICTKPSDEKTSVSDGIP